MPGVPRTYPDIFPQIEYQTYWSNDVNPSVTTLGLYIDFQRGSVGTLGNSYGFGTQCVRAPQPMIAPGSRFRSSMRNNEFVTIDNLTGLMWQNSQQSNLNWQEAMAFCESSNYAGFDDWRLPKTRSLMSLIDYTLENPATPLRMLTEDRMWSSTSLYLPNSAICIDFRNGGLLNREKRFSGDVVCVR